MSLPASKTCRARPGLKRPAQVTVQQMQKKDLKEKRPEQIFNAKWCEGRPWLGHKKMCAFTVTCVKKSMVRQHFYFYLQNRK